MSNRKLRWFAAAIVAVNKDGETVTSMAFVPARSRDEAAGRYTALCLRRRPGYRITSVVCYACPRSGPHPSTGATTEEEP